MNTILSGLGNHFLIAMPCMEDPNFQHALIYVCEHNEGGALGIVVNRPTSIHLTEVLDQMQIKIEGHKLDQLPILYGGPVHQERGFVIHKPFGDWRSSFETNSDISVTTSRDILQAIANNEGPEDVIIALGYAGWGAGQLESELAQNTWLSCPAQSSILFDTPFELRWKEAAKLIGIDDINTLSRDAGHA